MQLQFELPELDRRETQQAVEDALDKCRIFKQIGFEPREQKLTASYDPSPRSETNRISRPVEDIVIHNVDVPEQRRKHVERVEWAVKRLGSKERQLIIGRYLEDDYVTDYEVYNNTLHISESSYYRIKWRAFYKLAFALKLEVVKQYANRGRGNN